MAKIVLFGDSILGGFSSGRLTPVITNQLQAAFPNDQIANLSIAGATTFDALEFLDVNVNSKHPDLVILNFGINDASNSLGLSAGRYNSNLNNLVEKIGPQKVILISPSYTNWRVASDQSWTRILQFSLVTEHVAKSYQTKFLNLSQLMYREPHPEQLLQKDGIHLNARGNELLLKHLIPLIKEFKEQARTFA